MAFDTLVDKAQLENSITATADAIRAKTGTTDKIVWDMDTGFTSAINELTSEQINTAGNIPANLKVAALEVAKKVNAVRKSDSIVFMAMSDSHHTGEQSDTSWQTLTNLSNLHAGMAAKVLSYALDLDFVCHLGDLTFGHGTTTSALLHQQIGEMNGWLDEAWAGIPRFQTVGNHDTGYYAYTSGNAPLETNDYLFSVFGKYCEGAEYGSTTYGYCYRDFEDKKLRVICLNTSEGDSLNASYECSPAQLLWFAQTLKSVGAQSGWNVIVLGHYPLDYYNMHDATAVVKAYVDGASITLDGTTVNFSGSNKAKFVANFHGHTHCFKIAKLNALNASTKVATEYDALRIGTPNSGYYRNNHQEGPNPYGLYFEEEVTYDKVNDGVNDTAFVVNVITPSEEVIHSFCYGAGYDRSIGYGDIVYHSVTKTISNVTIDNDFTSVPDGSSYTASITPNEHYSITSITVIMGSVDITSSVYADGVISIPKVTGDVVIVIKAIAEYACVNQIPISTDASGAIYNGIGYKSGVYLSSSDGYTETARSQSGLTGFIPAKIGDIIRLKDVGFTQGDNYNRMTFYNANKEFMSMVNAGQSYYLQTKPGATGTLDANNNWDNITLTTNGTDITTDLAYIRISASGITDQSIITVNEEILYADEVCTVESNFVNVTCSNEISRIKKGYPYTAKITVPASCEVKTVSIIMGGVDITSTAYVNGEINISSVTGNLEIEIIAEEVVLPYTNQLPISTDASGAVYNGKGYKENTYISSGNEGTKNGSYTSGFIPAVGKDRMYFENVSILKDQDSHRIAFYDADKSYLGLVKTNNTGFTGFTWNDDNVLSSLLVPAANPANVAFVRFCCGYLGEDSVVTVNEPLE